MSETVPPSAPPPSGWTTRGKILVFVLLSPLVAIPGLLVAGLWAAWPSKLPDQETMIARFRERKPDFERLLRMSSDDRLYSMRLKHDPPSVFREGEGGRPERIELSPVRLEEYRTLMQDLGVLWIDGGGDLIGASEGTHRKAFHMGYRDCGGLGADDVTVDIWEKVNPSTYGVYFRRIDEKWCLVLKGGD